jgi:hypothetical protein
MGCHLYFGARPLEHAAWVAARIGLEEVERLQRTAKQPHHGIRKRVREIAAHFRQEFDRMKLGGQFSGWPAQ